MLEGLQDALGDDVRVLYSEGSHLFLNRVENLGQPDDRISEALTVAEEAEKITFVGKASIALKVRVEPDKAKLFDIGSKTQGWRNSFNKN